MYVDLDDQEDEGAFDGGQGFSRRPRGAGTGYALAPSVEESQAKRESDLSNGGAASRGMASLG